MPRRNDRRRGGLLKRGTRIALRPMVKAPVVDTYTRGLCDAQVIVPMADAPWRPRRLRSRKHCEPPTIGTPRWHADSRAWLTTDQPLSPDGHNYIPCNQDRDIISLVMCTGAARFIPCCRNRVRIGSFRRPHQAGSNSRRDALGAPTGCNPLAPVRLTNPAENVSPLFGASTVATCQISPWTRSASASSRT